MADIHLGLLLAAPPSRVFEVLSTQKGLSEFWTDQAEVTPVVGSTASFAFGPNGETVFRMRVDKLESASLVEWTCLGDPPPWANTTVRWDLKVATKENTIFISDEAAAAGSQTVLHFTHTGWQDADFLFAQVGQTWAMVLNRLSEYVKSPAPMPYFTRLNH